MPVEKLSASQESDLRKQLRAHYNRALSRRSSWGSDHARRLQRFHADPAIRPRGPWPESARLNIPITQSILERTQAQFFSALYGNPAHLKLQPFSEEDVEKAKLAERFLRWALTKTVPFLQAKASIPAIAYTSLQDALVDGIAVLKIYPYDVPWVPPSADAKRFLKRIVQIDLLDVEFLLNEPGAEGLQYPQSRYLIQQIPMSWDDVQRLGKRQGAQYKVPTKKDRFTRGDTSQLTEGKRVRAEMLGVEAEDEDDWSTMFVEQYERFDVNKDGLEEDVVVSWFIDADEDVQIARIIELGEAFPVLDRPLRPFFPLTMWPQSHDWRGMNIPDRLLSMQDVINRLHEQMINYGELAMLPSFFYNAMLTGEIPSLREIGPGEGIPVFDLNGVQFVQPRSLNRHFVELIQQMLAHVERSSMISDFSLGRQPDRPNAPRTYGGTMALLGESQKGFAPLIQHQAGQHSEAHTFFLALWQDRLSRSSPVQAPIFDRGDAGLDQSPVMAFSGPVNGNGGGRAAIEAMNPMAGKIPFLEDLHPDEANDLLSRLFGKKAEEHQFVAGKVTKEALSGLFDVYFDIDPNEQFNRQILLTLAQTLEPKLTDWPKGLRYLWEKVWESFGQHGFDRIYPPEVADLQTAGVMLQRNFQLQQLMAAMAPQPPQGAPMGVEPGMEAPAMPMEAAPAEMPVAPEQGMPMGAF